jgi:aminoglycoside 6'-N-acetyltransferase
MLDAMRDAAPVIVDGGDLIIRAMLDTPEEYARMAAWRNQPHVREWWDPDDPPMTVQSAIAEYRPDVMGETASRAGIIEVSGTPVGFIQFYPWAAYASELTNLGLDVPEGAWGLDIYIGDAGSLGRGVGSRAVRMLCDHLFSVERASAVAFGVERDNRRARRAYEKAGMRATREYLDSDTRCGERVWSIFLLRMSSAAP